MLFFFNPEFYSATAKAQNINFENESGDASIITIDE